jgi:hypothetical protein
VLARARSALARSAPYFAWSATLLLALAAWLSVPRPDPRAVPTRPALRALLVDLSASVTRRRPAHSAWLREALLEAARAARAAREEVLVVTYAADVDTLYGPGPASGLEDLLLGRGGALWHPRAGAGGDLASDLCAALALARSALRAGGRAPGRLEILGDGGASDGEPRDVIEALAGAGVSVHALELPPCTAEDLAIAEIVGPGELASGAPRTLRRLDSRRLWRLATRADDRARDRAHRGTRRVTATRTVELPPDAEPGPDGRIHWSARVDLGVVEDGFWEIDARARSLGAPGGAGDPVPENDRARAAVRVGGSIVLALARSAEVEAELEGWLSRGDRLPGFETLLARPEELAARLADVDVLVSADLGPALARPPLASFVRRGGWPR